MIKDSLSKSSKYNVKTPEVFPSGSSWRQRQWQQGDFSTLGTRHCCNVLTCQHVGGFPFCPAVLEPWCGHSCLTCKLLECQTHLWLVPFVSPRPKACPEYIQADWTVRSDAVVPLLKHWKSSLPLGKVLLSQASPGVPCSLHCSCPSPGTLEHSPRSIAKELMAGTAEGLQYPVPMGLWHLL